MIITFFLTAFILTGCKESKNIKFCEGITPKGGGVNCGTKFEAGDLTIIVTSNTSFEVPNIKVDIFEVKKDKEVLIESLDQKVNPENRRATLNLSLYNEGTYKVKAKAGNTYFAEGDIEVLEY